MHRFDLALCGGFIAAPPAFAAPALVVGVESPPKSMNPHSENGDATLGVMANIFDGLMQTAENGRQTRARPG